MGHLVIVPALGHQLGTAFLVSPGGEQNGGRPVCPDLPAELLYAGKEALGGGDVTVAHLLKHHIVPLLLLERRLGLTAQPGVGIRVFRQPRPAPGVVDHLRPGQVGQHLGYIIGEDKAVTQHEDPHGAAPYSFISLLLTVIIHGSAERNKARKLDESIRFCDARFKDKAAAVYGGREWVVMTTCFKNCTVYFCLFSERIVAETDKKL